VADSGAGTTDVLLLLDEPLTANLPGAFSRLCSFADWLCRHGHLVRSLKVEGLEWETETAQSFCQILSSAWRTAVAGPRPLHLQRFELDSTDSAATGCLLDVLPDSLTELDVFQQDCLSCRQEGCSMVDGPLARLTALKALIIRPQGPPGDSHMHPDTLVGLTGLTRLDLAADVNEVCNSQIGSRLDAFYCSMRHAVAKGK